MSEPITKDESNAYLDGWQAAHNDWHRGAVSIMTDEESLEPAWLRGFDDCKRGAIDADWALGPDKLPHGAMKP